MSEEVKTGLNELKAAMEAAQKDALCISSTYLSLDNLSAGTVINAFHLAYKYEMEDKLDEKTGAIVPTPRHTVMFLAFENGTFKIYVSSSKVLAETIGSFGIEPLTAIQIKYLGRKGTASRKYGAWEVGILPVNLSQFEHLLPSHFKPIMTMAKNTKSAQLAQLMATTSEEDAHVALTHQPE
ncbi:hypothetical protein VSS37_03330 [Candidatus Thiothrix sp. Deng01]|uniref:Uncharacterized protein n=1 Tax=Candidatus Thiothrix phosphatis TaxID=3112415 RepID=A0ABU6CVA7_9GAMM|nr:hypothetical protein [Candidatus Thiothrix sp. Deng01]MEB4590002.1 hypothetical protein [Candidatus Thiothrix sp. Deng01]